MKCNQNYKIGVIINRLSAHNHQIQEGVKYDESE